MRGPLQSTSLRGRAVSFLGTAVFCLSVANSAFAEAEREFSVASGEVVDVAFDMAADDDVSGAIKALEGLAQQPGLSTFEKSAVSQMIGAYHYELGQLYEAKAAFDAAYDAGGMSQDEINGLKPILANLNALEKLGVLKPKVSPAAPKVEVNNVEVKPMATPDLDTAPMIVKTEPVSALEEPALLMASTKPTIVSEPAGIKAISEPVTSNEDVVEETVSDRDAQPLVRIPPIMPRRFLEGDNSGYCDVAFNVSAEGIPFDVKTTQCTDSNLRSVSIKSVKKWKYDPKIVNGRAVVRNGVEEKVSYVLTDERGKPLPLPSGF